MKLSGRILPKVRLGATILSALLCFASLIMLTRSRVLAEVLIYETSGTRVVRRELGSAAGMLMLAEISYDAATAVEPRRTLKYETRVTAYNLMGEPSLELLGVSYRYYVRRLGNREISITAICVPYWLFSALFAAAPALWFFRRPRRRVRGTCHVCGYDLQATPQRCPECGTIPANSA